MERKAFQLLAQWKANGQRKPLILLGARQVGKTWLMREFGCRCYSSVAYINCDAEPLARSLFEADYNLPRMLLTIQAITGVYPEPHHTLIIFDELQEVPRGLHSLKYFQEQAPDYHVVAAGSLLGITLQQGYSFPVGKVDMLTLHPMDFEEFLMAQDEEGLLRLLQQGDWSVVNGVASKLMEHLRYYYYVGGMPEVVAAFTQQHDLMVVRQLQENLLNAYRNDISKHCSKAESVRIGQVLDSLPSQLAKENKKFLYGVIRQGARAREYELAIQWLIDAGIVQKVSRVKEVHAPLKFYEDLTAFKLFLLDCGLFACMAGAPVQQMIVNNDVFKEFKGAFTEQFVLQQLTALGLQPYYWSSTSTPAEIDFVVQTPLRTIPIEVKVEENVRAKSLKTYVERHLEYGLKGLRISMLGYENQTWMENIPLYGILKYFASCAPQAPFSPRKACE